MHDAKVSPSAGYPSAHIRSCCTAVTEGPTADEMARIEPTIKSQVAAAKDALAKALADPNTAWAEHCRKYNLGDKYYADPTRKDIFIANLKSFQEQNIARKDEYMAFGLTQFSHLTKDEFAASMLMDPLPVTTSELQTASQMMSQAAEAVCV